MLNGTNDIVTHKSILSSHCTNRYLSNTDSGNTDRYTSECRCLCLDNVVLLVKQSKPRRAAINKFHKEAENQIA